MFFKPVNNFHDFHDDCFDHHLGAGSERQHSRCFKENDGKCRLDGGDN